MNKPTLSEAEFTLLPTKRALLALKHLQAKLDAIEQAQHEPIAIVGMSCRFPGGADTPATFWKLLQQKIDAIAPIPPDRWSAEAYHSKNPNAYGKTISHKGGFIPHLYDFDAAFFRISPREAVSLDPQQRLALELGWEALEHAAISPDAIATQPIGVFLGISSIDYWGQLLSQSPTNIDAYLATGNTHSVAAGRLSYLLGINGPSLAIDTACSSSLVAVHLACQSLRQQECQMALVGGVNRIITPAASINFSKAKMLSADGRCRTFDESASGFGRAEGGGMVVLKRLSDAQAQGDRIHAVILGSATNHNGRTNNGLTAPSTAAQAAVIRQALKNSRIEPEAISYVETHGTGTALGDPIEVAALSQVFSPNRSESLSLGAVKTNIGHTEAAAGIAGLIKATLALEQREIPANLHLNSPNPHIDWNALPFQLPKVAIPLAASSEPITAGVSAFGFNGTNAHLVLQSAPAKPISASPEAAQSQSLRLFPLSARTSSALTQLIALYAQHLSIHPNLNLTDLCLTASTGRSHFSHRIALLTRSVSDLRQLLISVLSGRPVTDCWKSDDTTALSLGTEPDSLQHWAQTYAKGDSIDWLTLYPSDNYKKLVLPTYPFQREHYGINAASINSVL